MLKALLALVPFSPVLWAAPAAAHAGHEHEAAYAWSFEPWLVVCLILASALYALGARRTPACGGHGRSPGPLQWTAFAGGILALILALMSPIDRISADLFSVHMAQHLTLMLVTAPLLVLGRPILVMLWSLPQRTRKAIARFWSGSAADAVAVISSPLAVWLWFCGLFIFWHIPGPYALAVRYEPLHVLEHVCFLVSAYAFWSIVIEPSGRRRLDHGAALLFVITAAILSGLPGALMVLTSHPFYLVHADGAARWGLTLIADQQLAGLIMWVPAGFAYMAAILVLFVRWLDAAEQRAAARTRHAATLTGVAIALLLVGCSAEGAREPRRGEATRVWGGDIDRGAALISEVGCGFCHIIPGIAGADGLVGPPLDHMGRRIFVAGLLRNTPENMVTWLRNPQAIVPGNAMPNAGLGEQQARDITAYLYTLR